MQDDNSNETPPHIPIKPLATTSILAKKQPEEKKKRKRKFTTEQLKAGQTFLTQPAATNRFDSQQGMTSFGAVRHVSDIKVTELYDEEYEDDEI